MSELQYRRGEGGVYEGDGKGEEEGWRPFKRTNGSPTHTCKCTIYYTHKCGRARVCETHSGVRPVAY